MIKKIWSKCRLTVIILLSITIGAVYALDITDGIRQYKEIKSQYDWTWNETIHLQQLKIDGEKVEVDTTDAVSLVIPEEETEARVKTASRPLGQIEELIQSYFKDEYQIAKAVFQAESGLNPNSQGWNCHYGAESRACTPEDREKAWSVDCGLAQINVIGKVCPQELFNPDHNLKVAREKFEKRNWQPWCAFTSGKYLAYL